MCRYSDLEVLFIGIIQSSRNKNKNENEWRIDVGVKRKWPMSWFDCPPWKKVDRRQFPVRTFLGSGGLAWSEITTGTYLGVGDLTDELNGLIAMEVLNKSNSSPVLRAALVNNLVNED